ncbi:glucan endo-1,3-beta-glucosidase 7-like [Zingiber officinale]|uniref:glucan endo-1,3-beta-glucosidase 7-like n=1 Tax=Zingiber officinale TaxID=94328 RepID=UPI001C4CF505|nr:glucan endo-1,3-beta-glucosidase 7-like [Zingiber officinale]
MASRNPFWAVIIAALFLALPSAKSQSFIGVNYGEVADNLPPPADTARLLQSTTISKVRLYGADPNILRALAGTGISVVIGAANGDIPALASDPMAAANWVSANVLPFIPATDISVVALGNEAFSSGDASLASQLLPAMQNLRTALAAASSAAAGIKVSTVNIMSVLASSDPPSSGAFHADVLPALKGVLAFLKDTGSPFMINPYPFFAYQSDPSPETLAFCLFQPNAGRHDAGSGSTYMNMFDAQVDAVRAAIAAAGFPEVEIVVAETGWPYRGDAGEEGATVENAQAYNGGLVAHLRSLAGTPMAPGKSVDTYIFALYDEDLKPGPTSERSFGLFRLDLTPTYDAGITKSSSNAAGPVSQNSTEATPQRAVGKGWCVPKLGATEAELQANLDYACGQRMVDCSPIQQGGACFEPNTVRSHAAYSMNQFYQVSGRNAYDCDFSGSAVVTTDNPSYSTCVYNGGQ